MTRFCSGWRSENVISEEEMLYDARSLLGLLLLQFLTVN